MKTLFATGYTYKVGPHTVRGTEFFKDRAHTEFVARNPYQDIRTNQIITLNDCRYWAVIDLNMPVTYHRSPTRSEIAFGYGATHYRDFELADCLNKEGAIKKWIKADDGLRYYR